jgi:uncharacterized membrane protein YfcA
MILIPILLLIGLDIKSAISISIVQMVFSSFYGSYLNYKKGSLVLGDGIFVGVGGFLGGLLGAWVSVNVPDSVLEYLFLGLLIFALYRLFQSKPQDEGSEVKSLNPLVLFVVGVIIGIFAISLGVGGSIMLTPILVGFLHYPIKKAVSAGLFFVTFSSVSGLIGHIFAGDIDFKNALIVAFASLVGVYIGIYLKDKVSSKSHKRYLLIMYLIALTILLKKLFIG